VLTKTTVCTRVHVATIMDAGDAPKPPTPVYMPSASSQTPPPTLVAYDKLLMIELSANLYGKKPPRVVYMYDHAR